MRGRNYSVCSDLQPIPAFNASRQTWIALLNIDLPSRAGAMHMENVIRKVRPQLAKDIGERIAAQRVGVLLGVFTR